eukprot:6205768-Pleurochrysis_carterae.AAC.1
MNATTAAATAVHRSHRRAVPPSHTHSLARALQLRHGVRKLHRRGATSRGNSRGAPSRRETFQDESG